MTTSLIPLRSGEPLEGLLHLVVDEVELEVGCVHSRHLSQPRNRLGGKLDDCQVQLMGLSQTIVLQVVSKPERRTILSLII